MEVLEHIQNYGPFDSGVDVMPWLPWTRHSSGAHRTVLIEVSCMLGEERLEERERWVVVTPIGDVHSSNKPYQTTSIRLVVLRERDVADNSLLVVSVQGGHKSATHAQPRLLCSLGIVAVHISSSEVLDSLLVMSSHHSFQ